MDRQSQQLVVASVVAFLTSGVITLAGLSAAQETMHMEGSGTPTSGTTSYTPPPSGSSYTPPADSGTTYQQPSGSTSYTPPQDSGTSYQQPSGGSSYQQPAGGSSYTQPTGDWSQHSGTSTYTQPTGDPSQYSGSIDFQKDGANYQRDGSNFQKDGAEFHKGAGAPDFGGKTGAGRSFRDGFGDKEGAERAGGRFDRKGGFYHEPTGEERNAFESGGEEMKKRVMKQYGGSDMEEMGNKAMGKKKKQDMSDSENEGRQTFFKSMKDDHGVGVGGGSFEGEEEGRGQGHSLPSFESDSRTNPQVGSFLDSLSVESGNASATLTPAEDKKVTTIVNGADKKADKAVQKIEGLLDQDPTKAKVKKIVSAVLDLYKQWSTLFQLSDALGDAEGGSVDKAIDSADEMGSTFLEGCTAVRDWAGSSWSKTKAAKACNAAEEVLSADGNPTEEE